MGSIPVTESALFAGQIMSVDNGNRSNSIAFFCLFRMFTPDNQQSQTAEDGFQKWVGPGGKSADGKGKGGND